MDFSIGNFALGAVAGAFGSEVLKQCLAAVFKRRSEKGESRRKSIRDDLLAASVKVDACLEQAVKYFTSSADEATRSGIARDLVHSVRGLGMQLNQVNLGLASGGLKRIDSGLLIAFRRAVTMQLGPPHLPAMDVRDKSVLEMYAAAYKLRTALAESRYIEAA